MNYQEADRALSATEYIFQWKQSIQKISKYKGHSQKVVQEAYRGSIKKE